MRLDSEQLTKIVESKFNGFTEVPINEVHRKRGCCIAYSGIIIINEVSVKFTIAFRRSFPLSKPVFFIHPYNTLGFIPHVEPDGFVCFIQDQNLILDYNNPSGVLYDCYLRTIEVLEEGSKGSNISDFLKEFEVYWARDQKEGTTYYSTLEASSIAKQISVYSHSGLVLIHDAEADLNRLLKCFKLKSKGRNSSGLYVPIAEGLIDIPPEFGTFWSSEFIFNLVCSSTDHDEIKALVRNFKNKDEYLFLGIPIATHKRGIVGIKYRKRDRKSPHPLLHGSDEHKIHPFGVERIDRSALVPRGGGNKDLYGKRVLLIGCGSLGGHIAVNIAKCGIEELTLCDPQILSRENIYRHILGLRYTGRSKVAGLKAFIEEQLPHVSVSEIPEYVEDIDLSVLKTFNVIIVATGEPTVNLYLNDRIKSDRIKVQAIFTWLEPYGIGGHALLINPVRAGCYNCLYDDKLYNRASFCHAVQPRAFTKTISGCSGLFVPFSYQDSSRTALLVSDLVTKAIADRTLESQILSWKGDSESFLNEGFKLSERYKQNETQLFLNRKKFVVEECSVCGRKESRKTLSA